MGPPLQGCKQSVRSLTATTTATDTATSKGFIDSVQTDTNSQKYTRNFIGLVKQEYHYFLGRNASIREITITEFSQHVSCVVGLLSLYSQPCTRWSTQVVSCCRGCVEVILHYYLIFQKVYVCVCVCVCV